MSKYMNIIRILHLNNGLQNPLSNKWPLISVLRGIKRDKGCPTKQKQPITPEVLLGFRQCLNLSRAADLQFWAICLVAYFGLLRTANLLPAAKNKPVPGKLLTRTLLAPNDNARICVENQLVKDNSISGTFFSHGFAVHQESSALPGHSVISSHDAVPLRAARHFLICCSKAWWFWHSLATRVCPAPSGHDPPHRS